MIPERVQPGDADRWIVGAVAFRIARGGGRDAGGAGLDLLGRLCEHLGWKLDPRSAPGKGISTLAFVPAG